MNRHPTPHGFLRFVRVHERRLVAISIVGLVLCGGIAVAAVLVSGIRIPVLDRAEKVINYWDDRWSRRVEYGERLVDSKDYPQALEYLVALDHDFPAKQVRHKRGMERERLLRALGHTYSELGKKRLALDTYRRLAEFDPRNFESRYLFSEACLRFGETEMAEKQFAEVLKIHPTHMPSVRAKLKIEFDRGNFAAVVASHESYLNAFLMQEVIVSLGQSSVRVNVPVDGRFHDVDVRLTYLPKTPGELAIEVGKFALEIKHVALQTPLLVGQTGVQLVSLWPSQNSWRVQEMAPVKLGSFRALGPKAILRLAIPPQPHGIALIRLTLRLFKPLDPDLWSMVEKSYKNLLRYDDLETARARLADGISTRADL